MILFPKISQSKNPDIDSFCDTNYSDDFDAMKGNIEWKLSHLFNQTVVNAHFGVDDFEFWFSADRNPDPKDIWAIRYNDFVEIWNMKQKIGCNIKLDIISFQLEHPLRSLLNLNQIQVGEILNEVTHSNIDDWYIDIFTVKGYEGTKLSIGFFKQLKDYKAYFVIGNDDILYISK
jgi:hypothetical protein